MCCAATLIVSFGLVSALGGAPGSPAIDRDAMPAPQPHVIFLRPTHAIRGVVRSIGESSVTIAGSGKGDSELTFVLSSSTHREGDLSVGAVVSVRYRREGNQLLATAVSAHPEKHHANR
jgi:hypothetical protein